MHLLPISRSAGAIVGTFIAPELVTCVRKLVRSAHLYGEISLNILDAPLPIRTH